MSGQGNDRRFDLLMFDFQCRLEHLKLMKENGHELPEDAFLRLRDLCDEKFAELWDKIGKERK